MSSPGKRKRDDFRVSDDETETHAPAKKVAKPADFSDESDDIFICNISKNRRVSVRNWNGKIWVNIREFYVKDGKTLRRKDLRTAIMSLLSLHNDVDKIISMSVITLQWNTLRNHEEDIDKALSDLS